MRKLYVEASIEGKRTHEWRDTLAIEVLEGGGSLEDVQLLLGHKSRKTTEKYYVGLTKKRMEKAIEARRRTWDADTVASSPLPASATSDWRHLRVRERIKDVVLNGATVLRK